MYVYIIKMDDQQLQDYYNMAVAEVVTLYKGYPKGENNVNLLNSCIKEYNGKHPSVNEPKLDLETDTNLVRIIFLGSDGDLNERLKKLLSDDKLVFFHLDEEKKATETSLLKGGRKSRRGKRNSNKRNSKKRRGSSKKRN